MENYALVFVLAVLGVVSFAAVVWFLQERTAAEEGQQRCRCACCGQKLRFRASRAGRPGQCPRCGHEQLLLEHSTPLNQSVVRVGQPVRGPQAAARPTQPRPNTLA